MGPVEQAASGYRLGRRPAFDGLRALAVGAVLLFHSTAHVPAGFYGVDVFFVLSGFLITTLLLDERRRRGRIDLRAFYVRRIRRLMPALLATLTLVAVIFAIWGGASPQDVSYDFVAILFYGANWVLAAHRQANLASGLLNPTWSLAIEEQFYLLWPITLILLLRRPWTRSRLVATIAFAAVASAILRAVLSGSPNIAYFATPTHADGILAGCALALLIDRWFTSHVLRVSASAVMCAFAGVIVIAACVADPQPRWAVFPVVVAAAVVLVAHVALVHRSAATRLLAFAPLTWVGERSYGIYLYQVPLLDGVFAHLYRDGKVRTLAAWVAIFAVADLSYRFLETPIRRRRSEAGAAVAVSSDANRPLG
jgi:peptidoglycan/LPS O-acetylase OafA/YrhL